MSTTPKAVAAYLAKIGAKGGAATTEAKQSASRRNGKKGGRPRKGLTAKDVTVSHEPPDGYWIDLPFGWIMPGGEHGIVEDTRRAALHRVQDAIPCECDRCTRPLH